jgi:tetratricopeptide (TPR) repeat protein
LQEADAAFFFGRENETAAILGLLARRPDRIITLLGQSGVGKSSLSRAGIIARLKSQTWPLAGEAWPLTLSDSRAFLPLVVRPGDNPLKELALAFAQLYRERSFEIDEEGEGWARRFAEGARLRDMLRVTRDSIAAALGAEPPKRFVLYIDQGEELYAAGNAESAARFSTLLAEAAEHEAFSVLLSLRSDYYTPYQNDRDLFLASERVDVLALASDVLTEIVRKPAETLGARFESVDMARRVVEATQREPGALPLLSDLMHDMWLNMQARGDGVLRWSDNPEIVDVAAPLRTRAEAFLEQPGTDLAVVRRLFTLHLAQVPKVGEPVRRRARRGECTPAEWALAETLADEKWRLLSLAGAADAEPVVEVAHEQLLSRWPRLSAWLTDEREFLVWRGQVEEIAAEAEGDLLAGRRLAIARLWFERRTDDLPPTLREFIAASIAADDRRLTAERQRQRRTLLATAAALVVALVLVGLAGWQWRVAEVQKRAAEAQRERAEHSRDLATQTANALIFDLAQKFRNTGLPGVVIADILELARKLQEQLAAGGESSPQLRRSQAAALIETTDTLLTLGKTAEALAAARQAHDILQALVDANPDSTDYQHELAVSDDRIGKVLVAQGDLPAALAAYRDGFAISKTLAAKDPGNTEWQRDLSVSDNKIGEVLVAQGDLPGALAAYRDGLAIAKALTAKDPGNTDWQRDLSISDERIGNVLQAQGDLSGALAEYRAELAIMEPLARSDPNNTDWQRFIAVVYNKVGDVLVAQGDLPGALAAYRDGLAIIKALTAKDSGNTQWQRDLFVSYINIGLVASKQNDLPGALDAFAQAEKIALQVKAANPTAATSASDLQWVQAQLAETRQKMAVAGNKK